MILGWGSTSRPISTTIPGDAPPGDARRPPNGMRRCQPDCRGALHATAARHLTADNAVARGVGRQEPGLAARRNCSTARLVVAPVLAAVACDVPRQLPTVVPWGARIRRAYACSCMACQRGATVHRPAAPPSTEVCLGAPPAIAYPAGHGHHGSCHLHRGATAGCRQCAAAPLHVQARQGRGASTSPAHVPSVVHASRTPGSARPRRS